MNLSSALKAHLTTFQKLLSLEPLLLAAVERCTAAIAGGNKLMFCGNGASAGDAQHLAALLVGRLERDRRALPALALNADASLITGISASFGLGEIFSRQINAIGRSGDVLFVLSTHGSQDNILRAVQVAQARNIYTIGLLGTAGAQPSDPKSALEQSVDLPLVVPAQEISHTHEAHLFLGHMLCGLLEEALGIGTWTA